jgi:MFS family permease
LARTHDPYASLRIPNFRWFIVSLWAQTIASQIQALVVGWQVYQRTKDPLYLGLIGLAEALPFILVALYAGHVADRRKRKPVAVVSTAALVGCALALLGFTLWPDFFGRGRVWPLYVVVFLSGIARSFLRPASTALSAELIPREQFGNAVAWRSSIWQFAAVVGPAAGGLIYVLAGPAAAYAVDVVLMAISGLGIALIAHAAAPLPDDKLPIGESLKIGVRFVFREPVILGAMTLDLFSVLFGGPVALLPIFADILHVGPEGLGMLRAAPAVGSVVMGLWLAHRPPLSRAGRTLFVSVAIFGLCMIGFGLSTSFLLSLLLLTLGGAADNVSVVIRSTMVQTMTPENMLGRVAAVNQIFIGSSNQIGEFESGVAARFMGTIPSVVFGGVMTLVVVAVTAWRVPQLRRLERIAGTALPSQSS